MSSFPLKRWKHNHFLSDVFLICTVLVCESVRVVNLCVSVHAGGGGGCVVHKEVWMMHLQPRDQRAHKAHPYRDALLQTRTRPSAARLALLPPTLRVWWVLPGFFTTSTTKEKRKTFIILFFSVQFFFILLVLFTNNSGQFTPEIKEKPN